MGKVRVVLPTVTEKSLHTLLYTDFFSYEYAIISIVYAVYLVMPIGLVGIVLVYYIKLWWCDKSGCNPD